MDLLLPSPLSVVRAFVQLACTAAFWLSVLSTLLRIFGGLALGSVLGAALAWLTYCFRWAECILAPAIRVIRATPVVCFILLVYLWVARANIPGVISALMVLPVMWGNLDAGLRATDPQLLELAKAYRFDGWKTVRLIYLPSLRPYGVSGLMTATGLAWKSGVAAEVICPPKYAIGTEISHAKTALETPELFAWTVVIIVLSLTLERVIRRLLAGKGAGA
jgi:NitT/TauT family transport system permease protein